MSNDSFNIWINNIFYTIKTRLTIFQFCSKINIYLPCFCYHEKLTIAGNCRICLVEANYSLVASCALPLIKNMIIFTNNKRVQRARLNILEFLLINHPLDCPICDQGGECDLQDISLVFGSVKGRFYEYKKRSIDNLNICGPFIKTIMTRCIHCSRCVRFFHEISGHFELGIFGRSNLVEIGTYINYFINDELSGNVIDLCPVGALTSMPFAFYYRSWEIFKSESIDILDSLGSSIQFDIVNNKIIRILPILNENINGEWITNKIRFCYDSFNLQRLNYPKYRINLRLIIISWKIAINIFFQFLLLGFFNFINVFCSYFSDIETIISLKSFFNHFGCSTIFYEGKDWSYFDFRFLYLLYNTINILEIISKFMFININLRLESPIINAKFRKLFLFNPLNFFIFSLGLSLNYLTFPIINLGNSLILFKNIVEGKNKYLNKFINYSFFKFDFLFIKLLFFFNFYIYIGMSVFLRKDSYFIFNSILYLLNYLTNTLNIYKYLGIISTYLGRISLFEVGLNNQNLYLIDTTKKIKSFYFFCGINLIDINIFNINIYQGFFKSNDIFLQKLDLILPTSIFYTRDLTYINLEGRIRIALKVINPFKFIFSDFEIFSILSIIYKKFIIDNFIFLKNFDKIIYFFIYIIDYSCIFLYNLDFLSRRIYFFLSFYLQKNYKYNIDNFFYNFYICKLNLVFKGFFFNTLFSSLINNYYSMDYFSKNSYILSIAALFSFRTNFSNFLIFSKIYF